MTTPDAPRRPLRTNAPALGPIGLRLADAAVSVGLSTRTLRRLVEAGDLPASRIGRVLLFKPADLAALLERNRVGGAA